ncbi:MAG: MFS transporter [Chloroflexi bacterium]|jgi:MFS family permease|nr:MFS transporter [Chloroflexota bacterium]MBT4515375.1 MFS transporter [Chloroflexota bacterium]MBT6682086.1 MFS transporter [Chloroflexota bacterium]
MTEAPITTVGRPRLDAFLVYGGRGVRATGMGILAVLIAIYLDATGMSAPRIGFLLGFSLVGGVALSSVVVVAGPAISRRNWFALMALITGISGVLLVVTDNFWLLTIGSFFGAYAASGMHHGPIVQLEQAGLAEVATPEQRTKSFAYLSVFSSGGRALGALMAGLATLLISVFDMEPVDAYRTTISLYAVLNIAAAAMYMGLSSAIETGTIGGGRFSNPLRTKSRGRILGISGLFGIDSMAGGMVSDAFVSFWLFTHFGVNEGTIGAVLVIAQLWNLASIWAAPYVARRIGLLNTMVWTQIVANFLLIAFALSPNVPIAIAVFIIRELFNEMDVPTRQSYVMAIVPPDERVMMAGANNLGRTTFRMPSTMFTGLLWSNSVTAAPFIIAASAKLVYDVAVYAAFRGVRPPEEDLRDSVESDDSVAEGSQDSDS